jgi:hypothetical protein
MGGSNFKKDLARGTRGEETFLECFKDYVAPVEGHHADFILKETGELLELKTDGRSSKDTGNMFIERWSDVFERKPGGPWQAKKNKVTYFVYFYPKDEISYWFKVKDFCKWMEKNFDNTKLICVNNYRWWSAGYKVPIEKVKELAWTITTKK